MPYTVGIALFNFAVNDGVGLTLKYEAKTPRTDSMTAKAVGLIESFKTGTTARAIIITTVHKTDDCNASKILFIYFLLILINIL